MKKTLEELAAKQLAATKAAWDAEKAAWDAACATKSDDKTAFEAAWADYDVAKAALVAALAAVSA